MKRQTLIFLLILTIASCRQSTVLTENEKEKIIVDVKLTLNNYYNDIRKSGLTAEFKYLDNSKDFFWVPPGYSSSLSYDDIANAIKENALKYKSVDNSFDKLLIIPLSKVLATYTGQLSSTMTDTSGKVMRVSLVETGILIKRQDGWKLLSGQTSLLTNNNQNGNPMNKIDDKTAYEISRIYPVSQNKLFNALTDSSVLKKIWGVQSITVDARVGGQANAVYIEGDQDWSFIISYKEVVPNEKIRWVTHFKSFPSKETRVTLLFNKINTGTELVVRMENFETPEERDANKNAWESGLNTLFDILK